MTKRKSAKELQDDLEKTVQELEESPAPEVKPSEPPPVAPSEPAPTPPPTAEIPKEEEEPPVKPSEPPPKEEEEDYKKKFIDSSRESLVLHAKNKKVYEAIETATAMPDPTDEELRIKYTDWDVMSETEQMLAKDNLKNKKALELLANVTKESKDIEAWNKKVDEFAADPKTVITYPDLEGKEDEFRIFASKPTRRGVPFEDLVGSFMFDVSKKVKPKIKGKMFETGTGGPNAPQKPKSDRISIEESIILKKTNYRKYKEYLLAGKIDQSGLE